eukprot:2740317-Rhodomonas_salina.1
MAITSATTCSGLSLSCLTATAHNTHPNTLRRLFLPDWHTSLLLAPAAPSLASSVPSFCSLQR